MVEYGKDEHVGMNILVGESLREGYWIVDIYTLKANYLCDMCLLQIPVCEVRWGFHQLI